MNRCDGVMVLLMCVHVLCCCVGMIDVSDVLLMLEGSWSGMIDVSDR
jgi:hypothetical protein